MNIALDQLTQKEDTFEHTDPHLNTQKLKQNLIGV